MIDKKKRVFHVAFHVAYEDGGSGFGDCNYVTTTGLGITEFDLKKIKDSIKTEMNKQAQVKISSESVIFSWQEFDYIPEEV